MANATKTRVLVTRVSDQLVASGRLTFSFANLLTTKENGKIKGTICSNRSNKRNREFFDHQLGCHIWLSTFILEHKLNNTSTVSPSFFFAAKTVNIWLSHRKTSKWLACSKSPYNALQTLEHWVTHVCLRIVSLLFDFTIWRLKSNIWRLFFTLSRQMATRGFFFNIEPYFWRFFSPPKNDSIKGRGFHKFFMVS